MTCFAVFDETNNNGSQTETSTYLTVLFWPLHIIKACYNFVLQTLTLMSVSVMDAGFLLGSLETVSCELHHTPRRFQIFFYFSYVTTFWMSLSSTTINLLSIRIFDVRSNVFKVSLQICCCCK